MKRLIVSLIAAPVLWGCIGDPGAARKKVTGTFQIFRDTYIAEGNIRESRVFNSDAAGQRFSDSVQRSDGTMGNEINQYDRTGSIVTITVLDTNRAVKRSIVQEYDGASDRIVKRTTRDAAGTVTSVTTYTYDAKRRLAKKTGFDGQGRQHGPESEYDAAGNLVTERDFAHGALRWVTTHEYDRAGNVTRRTRQGADQSIISVKAFTYDTGGNLVEQRHEGPGGRLQWRIVSAYDRAKRRTRVSFYENTAGAGTDATLQFYRTFEYDKAGNLVAVKTFTPDGRMAGFGRFEYDRLGNKTRQTYYDHRGAIRGHTSFRYVQL